MKKHIPNAITLINLFCGCVAIVMISENNFHWAFFFVALGIFFDFFDGFFARLFKVSSPLGLQLDSLADMVTSGVVPGYVVYKLLILTNTALQYSFLPYFGFIITLGACYRLANFNIDTRQSDSFIGLPTPANALFFLSIPLWINQFETKLSLWFLIILCFLSAFIMNAEIPLFSLKIKDSDVKKNLLQILFLLVSVILLAFFKFFGVAIVIVFYVLLSVFMNIIAKNKTVNG